MSEHNEASEAEAKAAAEDAQKRFDNLPLLDKGPKAFFDDDKLVFWVGIPLELTDPMMAQAILDRSKFELLVHYSNNAVKMIERMKAKHRILNPGLMDKARDVLGRAGNGIGKLFKGD